MILSYDDEEFNYESLEEYMEDLKENIEEYTDEYIRQLEEEFSYYS